MKTKIRKYIKILGYSVIMTVVSLQVIGLVRAIVNYAKPIGIDNLSNGDQLDETTIDLLFLSRRITQVRLARNAYIQRYYSISSFREHCRFLEQDSTLSQEEIKLARIADENCCNCNYVKHYLDINLNLEEGQYPNLDECVQGESEGMLIDNALFNLFISIVMQRLFILGLCSILLISFYSKVNWYK